MNILHAFRVGLVEGADFIGTYITHRDHSPGHAARMYGVYDYNYTDYPNMDYRMGERSFLEKTLESVGIAVGAGSNICLLLPQAAAYAQRGVNRLNHIETFKRNCMAAMFDTKGEGRQREKEFMYKWELRMQYPL